MNAGSRGESTTMKYSTFGWLLIALPVAGLAGEPLGIGAQRQLFLDDYIVEQIEGLQRTMHQPVKRGAARSDNS